MFELGLALEDCRNDVRRLMNEEKLQAGGAWSVEDLERCQERLQKYRDAEEAAADLAEAGELDGNR